ncbi:MAG: TonB-dependent receptor plug domain-containing protein, partial [Chitinophagaceae bacterium]
MLLLFVGLSVQTYAQNSRQISGKVTGTEGQVIAGASVIVKGATTGTTTNDNGVFSITAAKGAILVISSINYAEREVTVGENTTVNVQLASATGDLGEVVVVGYGTQRKRDVTGAVASVNLENMVNAPNTNIGQYLQGTVPGLNVGIGTSAGATPPISIRGRVTLNGSQATVIIVDGIQYTGSLSSINPDDIASIDILKDASATAVYGAQGANGVILITSRKGKYNQKTRIAFSSSATTQ